MKRYIYSTLLLSATIMVTACGNDTEEENTDLNNENDMDNASVNDEKAENQEDTNADADNNENENNENSNETNHDNENKNEEDGGSAENETAKKYEVSEEDWSIQPIDDADEQVVLMTIDDTPDEHGVEMAEILEENNVPAIFFVNGHFLQSDEGREQLQAIHDLGFEIGNHTMNHLNLAGDGVTEDDQYDEIVDLNDLVEDIIGEQPRFFRAPLGHNTDYSKELLAEKEMQWMNWTYGYDWEADYMEPEPLEEIMIETELLRDGANLLMHDRDHSKKALEGIIEGLRDKGYEFVDPDEIKN